MLLSWPSNYNFHVHLKLNITIIKFSQSKIVFILCKSLMYVLLELHIFIFTSNFRYQRFFCFSLIVLLYGLLVSPIVLGGGWSTRSHLHSIPYFNCHIYVTPLPNWVFRQLQWLSASYVLFCNTYAPDVLPYWF